MHNSKMSDGWMLVTLVDNVCTEIGQQSPIEIQQDLADAGLNIEEMVKKSRSRTFRLVANYKRTRLTNARASLENFDALPKIHNVIAFPIDKIRTTVSRLASEPSNSVGKKMAMAFRNGREQTDEDLLSLWQDLIELGIVSPDDLNA